MHVICDYAIECLVFLVQHYLVVCVIDRSWLEHRSTSGMCSVLLHALRVTAQRLYAHGTLAQLREQEWYFFILL